MNLIINLVMLNVISFPYWGDASGTVCGNECCNNMFQRDGECIACDLGYYRLRKDDDKFCRPCASGSFGTNCTRICDCYENERCDNVNGCICKVPGETNCTVLGTEQSGVIAMATLLVLILFVLFVILGRRLYFEYQKFRKQYEGKGKGFFTFMQQYLLNCVSKAFKPHNASDNNDETELEESQYCYIRDSAMIQTLPSGGYSCDIQDGYNHLNTCVRVETTDTYNLPIYTKTKYNKKKINAICSPEYDMMNKYHSK